MMRDAAQAPSLRGCHFLRETAAKNPCSVCCRACARRCIQMVGLTGGIVVVA